ncbi:hypothetical protein NQ314_007463 [Rhamnusium bicolor]|uniref:FAD-binding PCMH-type domain-containing protein n=1 Tax=Rhamnusium bicolor TaxID=1586634 RepID=A0AAV8YM53_9CUCU|nr:hypothetical protein NQ314_007463 [Rhamnusium bicolor]
MHLTGTKRMCLEGGCGTCIVAVEETINNKKNVFAVNSCLVSVFSCHGWKIHTVEGIGGPTTTYHTIQKLLADNNGTQCGFCSPGMVMNMYALNESGPKTKKEIENSFGGNICRCTGYRPILTAFKKLASDAGVYRNPPIPNIYIDITSVAELTTYSLIGDTLVMGGNLTLTRVIQLFCSISEGNEKFAYLSNMAQHIDLIANVPVRNIGTLAGNLMIKYNHNEFPSDIFLILETYNAIIVIVDEDENVIMTSPKDFLSVDMNKKVIKSIILNALDTSHKYVSYKIMARAQNTHALVNAGFLIKFNDTTVEIARIVYGSINPGFVHATNTENFLKGKKLFDNSVLNQAFSLLNSELDPDYILPESSPEYRKLLAISLFYKYVLHIAPENVVSNRIKSGGSLLERPVSTGIQEFGTNKNDYPLGEPIIKVEALAQTSGQAEYIADIPSRPNQLYAAFVTAQATANSVIVKINTSKALSVKGVVAFFGKDDIPGENSFAPTLGGFTVQEELFCSGTVQYYDQPIGIIVADDHDAALEAAELVEVIYKAPTKKPYLSTKDVLKANDKTRIHHQSTVVPKSKGNDVKHVIKGTFNVGLQYHFHMEVQCCSVVPTEDSLDLYPSTQWMDLAQIAASAALKIPMNKINVYVRRLGGAYGAKIMRNSLVSTAAALAAYKLNKPVKMWMPLEKNMDVIGKRYPLMTDYEIGVNDKGVIQYLKADLYSDFGVGGNEPMNSLLLDLFENVYDIRTWLFSTYLINTDTPANCFTRAPGTLEGLGCIESIMEHIASSLNLEASDVKLANINKEKYPKILQFWEDMQTWGDVVTRKNQIKTYNEANRWKKRGMSLVPMAWTLEVVSNFTVLVSIFHGDGGVVVSHGGIEMGQGINTKVVQVCAYKFGISMDKISVKPSYNVIAPNSTTSGGSLTSESVCYVSDLYFLQYIFI